MHVKHVRAIELATPRAKHHGDCRRTVEMAASMAGSNAEVKNVFGVMRQ